MPMVQVVLILMEYWKSSAYDPGCTDPNGVLEIKCL